MASRSRRKKKNRGNKPPRFTAATADKHLLYELSVQEPEADVEFLDRVFRRVRGRRPMSLREDFCGTAKLCADWVRSHKQRTAVGLDLDQATLDWGRKHNLAPLGEAARRVRLLCADVRAGAPAKVEILTAFNFSYWTFQERKVLLGYFAAARRGLVPEGAFVLDIHGGPDAQCEVEEEEEKDGFTYVWDQGPTDAITGHTVRHIHFRFEDGSELRRAFTYDWRVWSLTEIKDVLLDAGFHHVEVYWEGTDSDGEGNGIFRKRAHAENEECWIAYIVAWPKP